MQNTMGKRFSPACAGNGIAQAGNKLLFEVQPRVCGERRPFSIAARLSFGSAPRVRGTGCKTPSSMTSRRFSPACAGNGALSSIPELVTAVQPRVCGERTCRGSPIWPRDGSAPRVRGTACLGRPQELSDRFSPACAGNGSSSV